MGLWPLVDIFEHRIDYWACTAFKCHIATFVSLNHYRYIQENEYCNYRNRLLPALNRYRQ